MALWEQDVHPIQFGFMCKFLIFLELEPFSTIMCPPSTESEYQKWQYNYIGQYSSRKVKGSMESGCPSYPVRNKKIRKFIIFLELEPLHCHHPSDCNEGDREGGVGVGGVYGCNPYNFYLCCLLVILFPLCFVIMCSLEIFLSE